MLRRFLASAAAVVVVAAAAAAAPYADRTKGFTVEVPDGWTTEPGGDFPLDVSLLSPRRETTNGVCLLMSQDAKTKEMTQGELNMVVAQQANEAFWRTIITSDKSVQVTDLTIKVFQETRGDRTVGRATATLTATSGNVTIPYQFEMMLQAVPGNSYMTHCAVRQDQVAVEAADINKVIDTFTALGTTSVVAMAPARGGDARLTAMRVPLATLTDAFKAGTAKVLRRGRR